MEIKELWLKVMQKEEARKANTKTIVELEKPKRVLWDWESLTVLEEWEGVELIKLEVDAPECGEEVAAA